MRKIFLFIICFSVAFVGWTQPYKSITQHFSVDQIRGCAPLTVKILNANLLTTNQCSDINHPCCMISPSAGCTVSQTGQCSCTNIFQFTFPTAGTYYLKINYQTIQPDSIKIIVDPNTPPPFEIYTCAGDKVEINITDKTYDTYYIDFNNDGTIDKTIPSGNTQTANFSYGTPGNYTIAVNGQKFNAANNCSANAQGFTALNALPVPTINSLTAVDASTLQLAFTPQPNIEFKSQISFNNSTNFQTYQTLYAVNSMTASNLSVDNNYYCFKLGTFDPCANTNTYTGPICSHKFSLTLASGVDQLAWQTSSQGVSNIQIERNNAPLATVGASTTQYNDKAITCKTLYSYQLISNYTNGATSTSLQKQGTAFLTVTPTLIDNTSAVVNNTQVDLTWQQDPAFTAAVYDVFRSPIGASFSLLDTAKSQQYIDGSYNTGGYCYQINYTDNCDNSSAKGLPSCPIRLSGAIDETNSVELQWSAYKGWKKGVKNYVVQRYYQPGQTPTTIYTGPDSTYIDSYQDMTNQIIYYNVTANAIENGVTSSISNEIRIEKGVHLFYPTAFNPDSKVAHVNKTFIVKGHYIATMKLEVFDRWGSLVFFSDSNEAWDGRRGGSPMPDATYVWTAEGTDLAGNSFKKAGTVVLIRK